MMTTKRRKIGRKTDWSDLVMPPTMHSEFNLATERNTRRVPTWSALGNASVARMIMGFLPLSEVLWWLDVCKTWRNHVLDPMTQAYWIRRIRKTLIDNKYCSSSLLDVFTSSGFWITGSALQLAMGQPSMVPPNDLDVMACTKQHDFIEKSIADAQFKRLGGLSKEHHYPNNILSCRTWHDKLSSMNSLYVDTDDTKTLKLPFTASTDSKVVINHIAKHFPLDTQKVAFNGKCLVICALDGFRSQSSLLHTKMAICRSVDNLSNQIWARWTQVLHPMHVEMSRYQSRRTYDHQTMSQLLQEFTRTHPCYFLNHPEIRDQDGYMVSQDGSTLFAIISGDDAATTDNERMYQYKKKQWFSRMLPSKGDDPCNEMHLDTWKGSLLSQVVCLTFEMDGSGLIYPTSRIISNLEPRAVFFRVRSPRPLVSGIVCAKLGDRPHRQVTFRFEQTERDQRLDVHTMNGLVHPRLFVFNTE
jgi:hypothetical protein